MVPLTRRLSSSVALFALSSLGLARQGLPPLPPVPQNPPTVEKALLGEALFWEEQLSSTRSVACGTCHIPSAGGSDPRSGGAASLHPGPDGIAGTADDVVGSPGVVRNQANGAYRPHDSFGLGLQVTGRKSPSMINAAYARELFWDGRASGAFVDPITGVLAIPRGGALESQAAGPLVSDVEMAHEGRDWTEVLDRLDRIEPLALADRLPADLEAWIAGRSYPELFLEVFGSSDPTATEALFAIATYERTLLSDQTPFDAFNAGDPTALTPQELRGRNLFNGPANCTRCHGGPLLTDDRFHNIGVRPAAEDRGRAAVTGAPQDEGAFKTPGLRNVALRAPYFHNGRFDTLADVVAFYDRGGDFDDNLSPLIEPLGLTPQQQADLVAFLDRALTDPRVLAETGPFERPRLASETNRAPVRFGRPTRGSGGFVPEMVVHEPGLLGNPNLTVGIEDALGGAEALLVIDTVRRPKGRLVGGARAYPAFSAAQIVRGFEPLHGVGEGAGAGWNSVSIAVPDDPALLGVQLTMQWAVFDPGSAGGLAATRAASIPLF